MIGGQVYRAVGRMLLAACAAALVASAPAPQEAVAASEAVVVKKKAGQTPAEEPFERKPPALGEDEYYLEFKSEAARDTTGAVMDSTMARRPAGGADSLDYFLEFPSDSLGVEDEVIEIQIDDDGVRIDSLRSESGVRLVISGWDESEDECLVEHVDYMDDQFDSGMELGYQRVDGLLFGLNQGLTHHDWRVPNIYLREIYSAKQDKWFYDVGIEQRIFSFVPLYLGASVYKITDSNPLDKEIIGESENHLAAFFFKEDYRDYFTRNGTTLHARIDLPASSSVKLEYLDDRYTSLSTSADWSLFRGSTTFRPNPPIHEGDMNSLVATYTLDTVDSDKCVPNGARVSFSVEKAGGRFDGDFDFTTLMLDARNYVKLSPFQFLRYHFKLGTRTQGTLPLQREFYVGGIGTLRGHDYKNLTGDQMVLGSIEYGAYAGKKMGLFVFVDSGRAWRGDGGFKDQRLELDAGVGIELLCHQTQIYAARDVKDPDSPILVGVRLNRTF